MLEQYEDVLTVEEAARILMVGRGRIYQLMKDKKLPSFRLGNTWKIPKDGMIQFLCEQAGVRIARS